MGESTQAWWDRTFAERLAILVRDFGQSHPPGGARGSILPFKWSRMEIPGAACLVIPPTRRFEEVASPHRHWLYVTVGLTQPVDPDHLHTLLESEGPSSYEAEFAVMTRRPADWAPPLLQQVMWYVRARRPLNPGDRLPVRFESSTAGDGSLEALLGDTSEPGCRPVGPMRALLVRPLRSCRGDPGTSIARFDVRLLLTITQAEWDLARRVGPNELACRLDALGLGECSVVERREVAE